VHQSLSPDKTKLWLTLTESLMRSFYLIAVVLLYRLSISLLRSPCFIVIYTEEDICKLNRGFHWCY